MVAAGEKTPLRERGKPSRVNVRHRKILCHVRFNPLAKQIFVASVEGFIKFFAFINSEYTVCIYPRRAKLDARERGRNKARSDLQTIEYYITIVYLKFIIDENSKKVKKCDD